MKKTQHNSIKHAKQKLHINTTTTTIKQTGTPKHTAASSTNPQKDHRKDMKKPRNNSTNTRKTKRSHKYHHHNHADRHNKVDSNIKHKPTQRPQ